MSKANDLFQAKVNFLLAAEKRLVTNVTAHQQKLFETLAKELLPLFEVSDGIVTYSSKNIGLINRFDAVFESLEDLLNKNVLNVFANDLIKTANFNIEYFVALGFQKVVVKELFENVADVRLFIGVDAKGVLDKKGYLYRLGRTAQVRDDLKNYVLTTLTSEVSFKDFQNGFKALVVGQPSKNVKGSLVKYFDQYAYDTFNVADAAISKQAAIGLGLKHFIYEGSTIKTTRDFCRKRAGKAYSVEESKTWVNDTTLTYSPKSAYKPLINRGGYRCRHFIKYITEQLYNELK